VSPVTDWRAPHVPGRAGAACRAGRRGPFRPAITCAQTPSLAERVEWSACLGASGSAKSGWLASVRPLCSRQIKNHSPSAGTPPPSLFFQHSINAGIHFYKHIYAHLILINTSEKSSRFYFKIHKIINKNDSLSLKMLYPTKK
jgi:hypothetical protein